MLAGRTAARGGVILPIKCYTVANNVNRHVANMEKGFLMSQAKMEDIISLCKRRGFIYQGSDVYGGLSGTWDYGPLGVQLKRNIMNLWWRRFVDERDDMYGVDAAILMNQKVWHASGHVDTFVDPLCEDTVNHRRYRTDHILKDNGVDADGMTMERMDAVIAEKGIKSPDGNPLSKSRTFNMMFETQIGAAADVARQSMLLEGGSLAKKVDSCADVVNLENKTIVRESLLREYMDYVKNDIYGYLVEQERNTVYLRPETAQGIFTNFKNVVDSFYPNLPFGIAQQGKAFRNEIAPRDFVFRSREFEQMEIEYFVDPEHWQEAFDELLAATHAFLAELGLKPEHIHELDVPAEDRAHYSEKTIDIEYDYPIGREELMGIAYRTDFDLMNIQRVSGKSMEYTVKGTNTKFVPHVIEPSFGVERALMAVLASSYREDEQNGEKRVYLALPEHLAPVKFAVSPLLKNKPELVEKAREVYTQLAKANPGRVMWDDNGNIGKRYRRQDEIGTPHCVVIDFQTLEDGTVTVRERDTTEQRRVNVAEL